MKNGSPTKVVLLNGQVTDTWSNEWRDECVARKPLVDKVLSMLGKHNRTARDAYYQWIGAMYGPEQEKRVREAVSRVWKLEGDRIKETTK
jgi:hypothetical protein